jgi:hypothetical protein
VQELTLTAPRLRRFLRGLAAMAAALLAAGGSAAQPYAPWAAPALGLPGPLPTEADLDRPFETPLPLLLKTPAGPKRAEAARCRDWLALRSQVIGSTNDAAWRVVRVQVVPCETIALLRNAGTALHSDLPADFARALATSRYPATLWPAPSADEQRRFAGLTLDRASGAARWEAGPDGLTIDHGRWRVSLALLARADFDHDGWEDAAFSWQAESLQGSYTDARLVVLTRRTGQTRFRALPVEPLLDAAAHGTKGRPRVP